MPKAGSSSERWKKVKESLNDLIDQYKIATNRESSSSLSVDATAELCIRLISSPSVHNYSGIKSRINHASSEWMKEFFYLNGLDVLFTALLRLSSNGAHLVDALLQIECVSCIKAVTNSQVGVQQMIDNSQFVIYLTKGKIKLSVHIEVYTYYIIIIMPVMHARMDKYS